jgi:hypothetical protein
MSATNYTPIQLYRSTTALAVPLAANLAAGELALNIVDGKLYYNDSGTVKVLAGTGGKLSLVPTPKSSSTTTEFLARLPTSHGVALLWA